MNLRELFEISMNPYMEREEFYGTLEEAKAEADDMITYTQQNIVIYKDGLEVTRRTWWGVTPDEEEENIIEIGGGYYSDWT